jgi:hypothetical protein
VGESVVVLYGLMRVGLVALVLFLGYKFIKKNFSNRKKAFLVTTGGLLLYSLFTYGVLSLMGDGFFGLTALIMAPVINGILGVGSYRYFYQKSLDTTQMPTLIDTCVILPSVILGLQLVLLFAFLFEGTICIIMAAPLLWVGSIIGSLLTYLAFSIYQKQSGKTFQLFVPMVLLALLPYAGQLVENRHYLKTHHLQVTTTIQINAPPEKVFRYVTQFAPIPNPNRVQRPDDLFFLLGLPAPRESTLDCQAENCLRKCMFTQNIHLDEKVTVYQPGRELAFDIISIVGQQNRLTGVDPHIMPGGIYFDNERGQFLLEEIEPGKTLIKGTTWYAVDSSMLWYAKPWAEFMLHAIHHKVLNHVKLMSEQD